MADLELARSRDDRRLYELAGIGTLRFHGWASRGATAEAGGRSWQIARRGLWRTVVEATDVTGTPVGEFRASAMRRGGTLRWAGNEFAVRPASVWRERYALIAGDRELAVLDAKGWGRRPVRVTLDDGDPPEPGLVLFAAFIVKGLAEDTGAAAGASAAAAS